jgi:tetratricopeptide (TPR) repeat protein
MTTSEDYKKLVEKVHQAAKDNKLDLSSDEDLSIAIMNLIGIEEHLFFTAEKTNKDAYLKVLNEVREMRKELLKKIIKEYEGEVWCISKHLLGASMRLMEVGTKHLNKGEMKEAKEMFQRSFNLYSLFWALNLKMVDSKTIKDKGIVSEETIQKVRAEEKGSDYGKMNLDLKESASEKSFFAKMGDLVKKAIDCCKE